MMACFFGFSLRADSAILFSSKSHQYKMHSKNYQSVPFFKIQSKSIPTSCIYITSRPFDPCSQYFSSDLIRIDCVILSDQLCTIILNSDSKVSNKMKEFHTLKVIDSKYSIKDKVLGQGSFATTYLAFDNKTGKKIACKMIEKQHLVNKINLSKNKTLTKDFFIHSLKNEVRTLKALHHQNIVQFIDFSETQNNIYIFLEYCAGGNLEQYLQENGRIPEQPAAKMMFQLAEGCAHLYDKNTYHRDLKTQNILIAAPGILKLSDFGFAKMVTSEIKQNPTSQTSVGTPFYMSPQLILSEPYTIKCDVWSLGVVFYKMIYNLMPWQRTDNVLVLLERMKKPLQFPPGIKVSEWIKQLLRGMLTVDEAKRLSMKQVHESLQLGLIEMDLFASSL